MATKKIDPSSPISYPFTPIIHFPPLPPLPSCTTFNLFVTTSPPLFYRKINYLMREFRIKLRMKTDITQIVKR